MPTIQSLVTPGIRTWVTGETYTPQKQNKDDEALRDGVEDLNSVMADLEKHYSSSTAPLSKVQGKTWHDSGNSILKLYHTANGTPVGVLDTSNAYNQTLSTGGSATFKVGGLLDKNTTQVALADGVSGDLIQYSAPGNTLSANGGIIQSVSFGTHGGGTSSLAFEFGSGGASPPFGGLNVTDWFGKIFIIRTGASSYKMCAFGVDNFDSFGATADVDTTTGTDSLAGAVVLTVEKTGTDGDVTHEMMLTQILH